MARLWSRNAAVLLGRNTVVSIGVFLIGLGLLWLLVEYAGTAKVVAAGATFLISTSLHYLLGRIWIYEGSERSFAGGFGFFLVNAAVGLAITLVLFDLLIRFTPIHYLVARIIVSAIAGLVMFLLNAILNFRRL